MSERLFNSSKPENLAMVEMSLSVGQCKVIFTLLWAELSDYENKTNIFKKNTLETLYEAFERHTREKPLAAETNAERKQHLGNWSGALQVVEVKHG